MRRLAPGLAFLAIALFVGACDDPFGPSIPQRIDHVVAGTNHTCAIGNNGHTYCWGDDRFGQLGARMEESCRSDQCRRPVPLAGGLVLTELALGDAHTCGIGRGQLYCWGTARFGRLGDDSLVNETCRETPAFKCAVVPRRAAIGFSMVDVTAGPMHGCGLADTGKVFCWGRNLGMQLGTGDTEERALPVEVEAPVHFESVTTGISHTCGVARPDQIYCWGAGGSGRLGTGDTQDRPSPTRVESGDAMRLWATVDAGGGHNCAIETNGVVSCWGLNNEGQMGLGDRISRTRPAPIAVPGNTAQVSAGGSHSCAVTWSRNLYCWGANDRGQLGIGAAGRQLTPVHVPIHVPVVRVSAGDAHTCAITADGSVYCWGANDFGQLGDGTRLERRTPVLVEF